MCKGIVACCTWMDVMIFLPVYGPNYNFILGLTVFGFNLKYNRDVKKKTLKRACALVRSNATIILKVLLKLS